jgi:DNA-binding PadR family transcriptional regulator
MENSKKNRFGKQWEKFHKNELCEFDKKMINNDFHKMFKKKMITFLILWIITKERTYGYDLIKKLNESSESDNEFDEINNEINKRNNSKNKNNQERDDDFKSDHTKKSFGSNRIYPILKILEEKDLIEGTWEMKGNRKIKYYEATEKGRMTIKNLKNMKSDVPPVFKEFMKEMIFDSQ